MTTVINAQQVKPIDILYTGFKGDVQQGLSMIAETENPEIINDEKIKAFKQRFGAKEFIYVPEKRLSVKANIIYQAYQNYW